MTITINNKNKKTNVPNLRFPEFQGEWEKCELGKLSTKITKKNKDNLIQNVLCNSATLGLIPQNDYFDREIANSNNTDGYYVVEYGDFVYNPRKSVSAPYGPFNIYTGNEKGIISPLYLCFSVHSILPSFLYYRFKSSAWFSYVYSHGDTGTRFDRVSIKDDVFFDMPIYMPSQKEQKKISSLLNLIDERISTQNKIIEDLKKLKSAIIEKVFNGKHSERLQLDNVGSYIRGLTYSSNDVVEHGGTLVMRSNNIVNGSLLDYNNNVVFVNKQMSAEQQLQNGDVVICMANGSSSLVGKSSFYNGSCHSPITVGAFCGIYRSKEPIVKWLFQTNKYRRYIWNSLQGGNGAIANLNGEDILNMSFSIPNATIKDTCVKMLTSVNSALENNMSLCALYTLQKQHLLRQMFI